MRSGSQPWRAALPSRWPCGVLFGRSVKPGTRAKCELCGLTRVYVIAKACGWTMSFYPTGTATDNRLEGMGSSTGMPFASRVSFGLMLGADHVVAD